MMMIQWTFRILPVVFLTSAIASADPVSLQFSSVWSAIKASSPSEKAASAGLQAAQIARDRSGRYWYPRIFLDARTYMTNDPAQTFFNLLGERQVSSADFVPSTLNYPGSSYFTQAGLGLDFPVYEGGAREARHASLARTAEARTFAAQEASSQDYLSSARLYGNLLALQEQDRQLKALQAAVDSLLARYKLGARGNPVGYSGLLGLKGLRNRLEAAAAQNLEQRQSAHDALSQMAGSLPQNWIPKEQDFLAFVHQAFPVASAGGYELSPGVRSAQAMAEAQEKAAEGEKSKFLPKVGLFAEENLYNGTAGTGDSYTAGAYLSWSLFSATDYGSIHEADLRTNEARANADARALNERVERSQARHSGLAAERTIRLLTENVQLLADQTDASRKLYQNGSINALQFLEVLSRRTDLLASLTEARLGLLEARVTELKTTNFEVPEVSND